MGIRVWGLDDRFPVAFFPNPKYSDRGICFSQEGRHLAILHRRENQDYITIYRQQRKRASTFISFASSTTGWKSEQVLQTPESSYLEDIMFAPLKETNRSSRSPIVAWESPAFSSRIFVFAIDGLSCKVISSHRNADEPLLNSGFERWIWSPSGWIAVVINDQTTVSIWNGITQKMGAQLEVGPSAISPGETIIFKEKISKEIQANGSLSNRSKCIRCVLKVYSSSFRRIGIYPSTGKKPR